jgi:archaellum component FlaC
MTDPTNDITNRRLSKLFSIETIGSLLVVAFVFGSGYTKLSANDKETEYKVESMRVEQSKIVKDVQTIQTDIAVIKNDNRHVKAQLEDIKKALEHIKSRN